MKNKTSVYFKEDMLEEIRKEAKRLDRSISWVIQYLWVIAKGKIKKLKDV